MNKDTERLLKEIQEKIEQGYELYECDEYADTYCLGKPHNSIEHKEYAVPEEALEEIAKKYADIIERNGKEYGVKIRVDLDENGNVNANSITTDVEEIKKEGKKYG